MHDYQSVIEGVFVDPVRGVFEDRIGIDWGKERRKDGSSTSGVIHMGVPADSRGVLYRTGRSSLVLPGFINMHVHYRQCDGNRPEAEDYTTGSMASIHGGATTVGAMGNTAKPISTLDMLLENRMLAGALGHGRIVVIPVLCEGMIEDPDMLEAIMRESDIGKIYTGISTGGSSISIREGKLCPLLEAVRRKLDRMPGNRFIVYAHLENQRMIDGATARLAGKSYTRKHCDERPREAEIYDVQRFLEAAERYDLDAHLAHLTTKESIGLAGEHARKRPGRVSAEVALHHTMFCDRDMERRGAALKMNPPLRPAADRDYVRGELLRGDMELMLVTDHAAHTRASKESPNPPSGITGSDHLGAAVSQFLATKELEPVRAAAITSFNAALRFGFSEGDDKRARIAEGFLGDLVELDPENEGISRIYTKCGHTPYALGEDAWPETRRVWLGGKLVADNGVLLLD